MHCYKISKLFAELLDVHSVLSIMHLHRYRHNRLVQIFGVCSDPTLPAIVYELMVGGSLFSHLHLASEPLLMIAQ